MAEEDSFFSFLERIRPTKDTAATSIVEEFEQQVDYGLDIFLSKEETGLKTPIKGKRKNQYLSPIIEGSKESTSDNTPTKTIVVPEPETTPKKLKKN